MFPSELKKNMNTKLSVAICLKDIDRVYAGVWPKSPHH